MKTHVLPLGLALAVGILGTLVGSNLLAPAGVAVQPQAGKDGIVAPVPPEPAQDIRSHDPKLRHTLQGPIVTDGSHPDAVTGLIRSMANFSLTFTVDGKTLVGARNFADKAGVVKLWDVATGKERASFQPHGGFLWFALTADGKTLAVAEGGVVKVKLWDVARGKERASFEDDGYLAFTRDGKTLAVGGLAWVNLWDVSTGKKRASLKTSGSYCRVAFSADGKVLAAVSLGVPGQGDGGEITLWDVASGHQRDPLPDAGGFLCAAFTPDGKTLAAGGAGVVLWDVVTCQKLATLKAHQGKVQSLAFTADGKTLASSAGDADLRLKSSWGQVKLWDMTSGKVTATLKGFPSPPTSMAFTPDGKTLATFCSGEIKLWDVDNSK